MGQTTGHLAARGSASRYMARRKAMRQATELGPWTICSLAKPLPGAFAPWPFRSLAISFPGTFVSELASVLLADSLRGANWPGSEKAVNLLDQLGRDRALMGNTR